MKKENKLEIGKDLLKKIFSDIRTDLYMVSLNFSLVTLRFKPM